MFYFATATLILRKRGNDLPVGGIQVRCGRTVCVLGGGYFKWQILLLILKKRDLNFLRFRVAKDKKVRLARLVVVIGGGDMGGGDIARHETDVRGTISNFEGLYRSS